MAKKSKRSRGNQKKKNRASQAPTSQAAVSQRSSQLASSAATARDLARDPERASAPPDSARASDRPSAPESSTRVRSSDPILPPPREASPSDPSADEISIPPVQAPADLEDSFFGKRIAVEKAGAHEEEEDLRHSLDPRSLQKMSPAAHARRAHLTRYVKGFVAAAAVLAAAGLLRVAVRGKPVIEPPPPIVHTAVAAVTAAPVQHDIQGFAPGQGTAPQAQDQAAAAQPAAVQPDPTPQEPQAATNAQSAPGTTETTAAQAAQPTEPAAPQAAAPQAPAATAASAAAATPAEAPAKTALEEKKDASRLLERGKNKEAAAAGERSVALDPADGEAWLVLGAAYQQMGKNADARKAFQSCLKEGKRGPIGECRAMLQ